MRSVAINRRWLAVRLAIFLLGMSAIQVFSQTGSTGALRPDRSMTISEVRVVWDSTAPSETIAQSLIPKILRAVNIYPNASVSPWEIEMAINHALAIPEVKKISWDIEFRAGSDIVLILHVVAGSETAAGRFRKGMVATGSVKDFPLLIETDKAMVKFNLAGSLMPTLISNTWWGNGKTFTQYNPFGNDPPGTSPALDMEAYLMFGVAGIARVTKGSAPMYLYAAVNGLITTTLGRELYNAQSNTFSIQLEEVYAGVVGVKELDKGHLFRYNLSFGKQPYRIGTGMLICQIGGNGGTWGGMNVWPRFSGRLVGLAKFALDDWKLEGFYLQPNEYSKNVSHTQIAGFNLEYNPAFGFNGGFTYLNAFRSDFPYFFPDYTQSSRQGLNAMNLRFQWIPQSNQSFLFAKAEGGLELNPNVPMQAYGMAFEGGWAFGNVKMRPSVSYRYSFLSGDNPNTSTYERWDFLYSGDDIFTWVQGVLLKNVMFNTNMVTHRFQLQLMPTKWRITSQYFFVLADQLNTPPTPVGTFSGYQIAQEFLIVAERFVSKNIYLRFTASTLWPGEGYENALPEPVSQPWMEFQALVHFTF
jgi:hypothetical protein